MIMAIREAAVPQWQRNKQTNTKRKWWHDLYHPTSFEESHVIWLSVFVFGVCASVRERFTHCLIIISLFTLFYCHCCCYCSTAAAAEKVSRPTLHCGSQARYNSQCRKSYIYWIFMEMKFKRIITIKHFSFCSLFFLIHILQLNTLIFCSFNYFESNQWLDWHIAAAAEKPNCNACIQCEYALIPLEWLQCAERPKCV